jgi:hypothetical protein
MGQQKKKKYKIKKKKKKDNKGEEEVSINYINCYSKRRRVS